MGRDSGSTVHPARSRRGERALWVVLATLALAPLLLLVAFATVAAAGPSVMIAVVSITLLALSLLWAVASALIALLDLVGVPDGHGRSRSWLFFLVSLVVLSLPLALLIDPNLPLVARVLFFVAVAWVLAGTVVGVVKLGPRALLPTVVGFALFIVTVAASAIAAVTEGSDDAAFIVMVTSTLTITAALLLLLWSRRYRDERALAV